MRIIFIAPPLELRGSTSSLYHLLHFLHDRQHQVALLTWGGPLLDEFRQLGIPIRLIPYPNNWLSNILLNVNHCRSFIASFAPDFLHVYHGTCSGLGGELARVTGKPYFLSLHHFVSSSQELKLYPPLLSGVITLSQALRENLVNEGKVPKANIMVIPNGVDGDRFHPSSSSESRERMLALGGLGRMETVRGYRFLIEAARKLADQGSVFSLFLAGEGPEESSLRQLVAELDLEEVVSFLPLRTLRYENYLQTLDIMAVPSLYEGLGQFILEAMSCGKPVVAFAAGGLCDCVRDGATGFLVPKRDVSALASRISCLMQDAALRRSFGEAARRHVTENFSMTQIGDQILHAYQLER